MRQQRQQLPNRADAWRTKRPWTICADIKRSWKLVKMMNVMDPSRSTKLSELLAGVVRVKSRPTSTDVAVTTINPRKGGEKYDGKTNEQDGKSHDGDANATHREPAAAGRGR